MVLKELHHKLGNRGVPPFDEPDNLREVWPWQHSQIDCFRRTRYEFLGFVEKEGRTMISDEIYKDLVAAVSNVGADITADCERFLSDLRTDFQGSDGEFVKYVQANVETWFRVVNSFPAWVQNADWQFHRGKPMVFVGETPIPKAAGLFHDDACVFVFLSDDGVTKCVIQVS